MIKFLEAAEQAGVVLVAAMLSNQPTGPSLTAAVVLDQVSHRLPLQRGPGHFFEAMSCSRALSRLSSALARVVFGQRKENQLGPGIGQRNYAHRPNRRGTAADE